MSEDRDKIEVMLEKVLAKVDSLEKKISKLESKPSPANEPVKPALARVLKTMWEEGRTIGAEDLAKKSGLARNRASAYLNELASLGYVKKKPNLAKGAAHYVFEYEEKAVPAALREQIEGESE